MTTATDKIGLGVIHCGCKTFADVLERAEDILTLLSLGDGKEAPKAKRLHTLQPLGKRALAMGYLANVYVEKHGPRLAGWEAACLMVEIARLTKKPAWKQLLLEHARNIEEWYAWAGVPTQALPAVTHKEWMKQTSSYSVERTPPLAQRGDRWQVVPVPETADEALSLTRFLLYLTVIHEEAFSGTTCAAVGMNAVCSAFEAINKKVTETEKRRARLARKQKCGV
jgi:hypothetical protein